jgi:hypothetical protein
VCLCMCMCTCTHVLRASNVCVSVGRLSLCVLGAEDSPMGSVVLLEKLKADVAQAALATELEDERDDTVQARTPARSTHRPDCTRPLLRVPTHASSPCTRCATLAHANAHEHPHTHAHTQALTRTISRGSSSLRVPAGGPAARSLQGGASHVEAVSGGGRLPRPQRRPHLHRRRPQQVQRPKGAGNCCIQGQGACEVQYPGGVPLLLAPRSCVRRARTRACGRVWAGSPACERARVPVA